MPVIHRHLELDVPAAEAFEYLAWHENVCDWMFGVTKFVPVKPVTRGIGDRFAAEMKLGPKTLHSTLDIVEWEEGVVFALSSVDGFDTSSRWAIAAIDDTHCTADVEFRYDFGGGFSGKALAKMVQPFIDQGIAATDRNVHSRLNGRTTP